MHCLRDQTCSKDFVLDHPHPANVQSLHSDTVDGRSDGQCLAQGGNGEIAIVDWIHLGVNIGVGVGVGAGKVMVYCVGGRHICW